MKILRHQFRARTKQHIKVTFEKPVTVRIMHDKNFKRYKEGMSCEYIGGKQKKSPYHVTVPGPATWHVVLELDKHDGPTVNPTIEVIDPKLEYVPPSFAELDAILDEDDD